jgi:preprotein translocase subunit SecB
LGSKSPQEMMILHIQSWYMKEMNLSHPSSQHLDGEEEEEEG